MENKSKILVFTSKKRDGKILKVIETPEGWLRIIKMGNHPENIFFSVEEMEVYLDDVLTELK